MRAPSRDLRRALSSGPAVIVLAALLFAVVIAVRFVLPDPGLGITFLFVAPIVLLGVRFAGRGAVAGVTVSVILTILWDVLTTAHLGAVAYVVRSAVFVFAGLAVGVFATIGRRLEQESTAWFEQAVDLHCIADFDGYFLRVNDAFVRTLGYRKEDLVAKPFIDFVHPDDRDNTIAETIKLAEMLGDTVDFENRYLASDGTYRWLRWSATPVRGRRIYGSARDVTKQKELERRLEELATTDPLTGLSNRRHFDEHAAERLDYIGRYGTGAAMMMIDLDGFKDVNDRVGHHAGDDVLAAVAERLRSRLRSSDLVARYGGDEFAVLLPETTEAEAASIASSLLALIERCSWRTDGVELPIRASIGIALFEPSSPWDLAQLVRQADQAMFAAKRAGGNRYVVAREGAPAGIAGSGRTRTPEG